jgi:hypothetical protein
MSGKARCPWDAREEQRGTNALEQRKVGNRVEGAVFQEHVMPESKLLHLIHPIYGILPCILQGRSLAV